MEVLVDTDTGTGTGTGTGTDKGLSASCSDIICKHCNERMWHDGQEVKQKGLKFKEWVHDLYCDPNMFYVKLIGHVKASEKHRELIL